MDIWHDIWDGSFADPVSFAVSELFLLKDYLDPSSVQHVLHFETLGLDLVRPEPYGSARNHPVFSCLKGSLGIPWDTL